MLDPNDIWPATALRRSFERARALEFEQQIQECVDLLQHPELVVKEVLAAYEAVCALIESNEAQQAEDPGDGDDASKETPKAAPTLVEDFFWETRELMVLRDKGSFTCLATDVVPFASPRARTGPQPTRLSVGLDYVGITCDRDAVAVLGAVQAPGDATAYPLLLRLLANLTEISPPAQLARVNQERLHGIADPDKPFDLNLVLWDREDQPEMTPLSQLTRDLAEKVKQGLREEAPDFSTLRDIVCLRMNPDRFDGRMRFDWRV